MSYLWNEFNIKTMPAETLVYCNGLFREDLSTITDCNISKNYDLPVHIIYVGQIERENTLNINITAENQPVFLSVNIENKNPAFLNIFIKNTGIFVFIAFSRPFLMFLLKKPGIFII